MQSIEERRLDRARAMAETYPQDDERQIALGRAEARYALSMKRTIDLRYGRVEGRRSR